MTKQSSTAYVICPKSGLSYTIIADWNASALSAAIHPDAAKGYQAMAKTIRAHIHTIPNSYIAAFCQVWARDNGLLLDSHKAYHSGWITETLAKLHRTTLINLFWTCYNSAAGINKHPLKINLDDVSSPSAMHDMFLVVASQSTNDLIISSSRSTYRPRLKGKPATKAKMDIISCIKRIAKLMPKLANADPKDTIPADSAKKAAMLLPSYGSIKQVSKDRVLDILDTLFAWAAENDFYTKNSLEWKSYEIVRKHIVEGLAPIALEEVDF